LHEKPNQTKKHVLTDFPAIKNKNVFVWLNVACSSSTDEGLVFFTKQKLHFQLTQVKRGAIAGFPHSLEFEDE